MEALVLLLIIAVIPAAIASNKGRNFFAWYVYGILLWIVALIHALVLKPDMRAMDERRLATGEMRKCPHCAELVKQEATVCRYCQRSLTPLLPSAPRPDPDPAPTFLDSRAVKRREQKGREIPPAPPLE